MVLGVPSLEPISALIISGLSEKLVKQCKTW